jgi:hypothetical protein
MARPVFAVLIPHAGRAAGRAPTAPARLTVLRMIPFEQAVRRATRGSDVVVSRPAEAGPVANAFRRAAAGLPRLVV